MLKRILLCVCGLLLALLAARPWTFPQTPIHRTSPRRPQTRHARKTQSSAPRAQGDNPRGPAVKNQRAPQSAPQVPSPALSDAVPCVLLSCAAFNRLIQAKDRTITLNLYVPTAYACFNPENDGFLVVGYSVSVVSLAENGEALSDGWVASDRYENGQDVDSDMALGEWSGSGSHTLQFHEASASESDSSFNAAADSLFSLSRIYKTIEGNTASLDLKISLPSLRFSESYSVDGRQQLSFDNAPCWTYSFDSRTSDQPAPSAATPGTMPASR